MIEINKILQKRIEYLIDGREDKWLDEIVDKNPDEVDVIVPISMFTFNHQLELYGRLLDRYNLKCVVKIKSPYYATNIWFYIISFTKKEVNKIVLSSYNDKPYNRNHEATRDIVMPDLTKDFINYINDINDSIIEGKTDKGYIYIINYNEFNHNNINPDCYSPSAMKIKDEIRNNKRDFRKLSDFALVNPNIEVKNITKAIRIRGNKFEEYTPSIEREKPVCKLKKGDIVLKSVSKDLSFETLLVEEDNSEKYVDRGIYIVIRPIDKKYTQYLRFYLSDPKTSYYFMSTSMGNSINHLSSNVIRNMPVLIPTDEMIDNSNKIYELENDKIKCDIKSLNEDIRKLNKISDNDIETKKQININIAQTLSVIKTKMAYQVINDDLRELDICYNAQAYKASVILCGSILEAILLDWLSEYEDTDSIIDIATYEDRGRTLDMGLDKIIRELTRLIKPYWIEREKANKIRETRNYIHPKLYIRDNVSITNTECKEIIEDLKEIISSRKDRQ